MINNVDSQEDPGPLHFGPGDSSIFLREAYASYFVAEGLALARPLCYPNIIWNLPSHGRVDSNRREDGITTFIRIVRSRNFTDDFGLL